VFKWLKVLGIALGLVVVLPLFLLWLLLDGCSNQLYQQFLSENGLYKAVVFQRDCGATTGFSTQVSIIAVEDELCDDCAGDVLAADRHPEENKLKLQWCGDHELLVSLPEGVKVYRSETQWSHWFDKVEIRYLH
jgi:hypothetical protein